MESATIVSLIAGTTGTITGTCGLILSILNFNRDKPDIQITLKWHMSPGGLAITTYDENKLWGVVSITNVGRRPIFFSHLHLEIPNATEHLLISAGVNGKKLLEGDPPKVFPVTQEELEKYADQWDKMRAVGIDSAGKKYYSLPAQEKPSWSK